MGRVFPFAWLHYEIRINLNKGHFHSINLSLGCMCYIIYQVFDLQEYRETEAHVVKEEVVNEKEKYSTPVLCE